MYNLGLRQFLPKIGDTPDNVGPNTYIFDDDKNSKKNVAPFLSDTERGFIIGKKQYTHALYNATQPRHIKGGSSLKNKSERTLYAVDDNPGPADYDPIKIPKKKPLPDYTPPPGKGKLYLCNLPPPIFAVGPSIPTKIDENGYYVNETGNLEKIPADTHDTTLGPAFYNVPTGPCTTTKLYKGCEWSKRRARRTTIETSRVPGPGTYNFQDEIGKLDPRDEYVREMARLFTYVPRSLEAIQLRTIKENIPGPGYYHVDSSNLENNRSMSIKVRPFVAGAKRFPSTESDTPTPNTYKIRDCLYKRKNFSMKAVPFSVNSERCTGKVISYGPGPAGYDIKSHIGEKSNKKRNFYSTAEVPFNMSAIRKLTFVHDDAPFMPGPANYLTEPLEMEKSAVNCCHLKSKSKRFPDLAMSENAEPATYSISETFNKNRDRTSHNTGKVPFQSNQAKGLDLGISDHPSPSKYGSHEEFGRPILSMKRSPRFTDPKDNFPGPGTYFIHPSYDDSVYKSVATHNLRLKESVLRTKLRLPPGQTWEQWFKELKKKKKLKVFKKDEGGTLDYFQYLFS